MADSNRNAVTQGSAQSYNVVQCKHGTLVNVGTPDRCEKCDDERWTDWFEHFTDRYERDHGSRYPIRGYDETHLREAYEHRF